MDENQKEIISKPSWVKPIGIIYIFLLIPMIFILPIYFVLLMFHANFLTYIFMLFVISLPILTIYSIILIFKKSNNENFSKISSIIIIIPLVIISILIIPFVLGITEEISISISEPIRNEIRNYNIKTENEKILKSDTEQIKLILNTMQNESPEIIQTFCSTRLVEKIFYQTRKEDCYWSTVRINPNTTNINSLEEIREYLQKKESYLKKIFEYNNSPVGSTQIFIYQDNKFTINCYNEESNWNNNPQNLNKYSINLNNEKKVDCYYGPMKIN